VRLRAGARALASYAFPVKTFVTPCLSPLRHPTMIPDATLFLRYTTARDAEAFAELVRRHAGLVFGVCRRICGNAADADNEVAQDCILQLARHADCPRSSLPGPGCTRWRCTRRCAPAKRVRRCARRLSAPMCRQTRQLTHGPVWRKLVPHYDQVLGGLPAEQRKALVLRYLKDLML